MPYHAPPSASLSTTRTDYRKPQDLEESPGSPPSPRLADNPFLLKDPNSKVARASSNEKLVGSPTSASKTTHATVATTPPPKAWPRWCQCFSG